MLSAADQIAAMLVQQIKGLPSEIDDDRLNQIIEAMSDEQVDALLGPILADEERAKWNKFAELFPDEGMYRRELYPKHMEFFAAGKTKRERLFMAANRVGKSVAGGFETTAHLTGEYPHWWPGHKFRRPIRAWVAGDTNETTRDILQNLLLGDVAYEGVNKTVDGSGLIPRDNIGKPIWKTGVQNLVDTIPIRHKNGGWSTLGFKSFDQGRRVFQGTAKELIWLDEECPLDVYGECLIRTATTRGRVLSTFTPLSGLSELVLSFMPDDMRPAE